MAEGGRKPKNHQFFVSQFVNVKFWNFVPIEICQIMFSFFGGEGRTIHCSHISIEFFLCWYEKFKQLNYVSVGIRFNFCFCEWDNTGISGIQWFGFFSFEDVIHIGSMTILQKAGNNSILLQSGVLKSKKKHWGACAIYSHKHQNYPIWWSRATNFHQDSGLIIKRRIFCHLTQFNILISTSARSHSKYLSTH